MSLGIIIKAPEGLVLAAESRVTLSAQQPGGPEVLINFDNATKLLSFSEPNNAIGAVTYGVAGIGFRTAHSFLPEFEAGLAKERLRVDDFAGRLADFFMQQWGAGMPAEYKGPSMTLVVGGFNEEEPYGRVFLMDIPTNPTPVEQNPGPAGFGITWGGQREFVDRLIQGYDHRLLHLASKAVGLQPQQTAALVEALRPLQMQIPLLAMPLQDCVDLAIFFVRTAIAAQRLSVGVRGCGGPVDVAVITRREGLDFVQRKQIVGEAGRSADRPQSERSEHSW